MFRQRPRFLSSWQPLFVEACHLSWVWVRVRACVWQAELPVLFMSPTGLQECECLSWRLTSFGKRDGGARTHTHVHVHTRAHTHAAPCPSR